MAAAPLVVLGAAAAGRAALSALAPDLPAGTTLLPPLTYEPQSASRFRLGTDPQSASLLGDRLRVQSWIGDPADPWLTSCTDWGLELDSAALPPQDVHEP